MTAGHEPVDAGGCAPAVVVSSASGGFTVKRRAGQPASWEILSPAGRVAAIAYSAGEADKIADALGWKPPAEAQPGYSIDADPAGIRARVADAITGALAFGAQGSHPPPSGHWLEPFWDMARAEAQAQGGVVVTAKPLEWQEDGPGEWCDRHHGFHITQDDEEPQEDRFTAAWGECDPERFPTLDEAQAWCQEALDRYIREWAITAPPSAPVGVDPKLEGKLRCIASLLQQLNAQTAANAVMEAVDALAPQPAAEYADADALVAHLDSLCDESDEKWDVAQAAIAGIRAAQQPAAVDGAMARRLDDYLGGEFDIRIGKQAAHAALTHALAAQPGGDQE